MRTHLTPLQGALVALLIGSAVLFLVGSTIERNHHHQETQGATTTEVSGGEQSTAGETGSEGSTALEATTEHSTSGEAGAKILGVNTESLALSIVAIVLSFVLAGLIWSGAWPRLVLLAALGFGLVFAAGDGRELVHQLDESNSGLATVAAILLVLHVSLAGLAAYLLRGRSPKGLAAARAS
jgi:hypothetical protein